MSFTKNDRLERLSDHVRREIPVGLGEALEVIKYQRQKKEYKKYHSLFAKINRFFTNWCK